MATLAKIVAGYHAYREKAYRGNEPKFRDMAQRQSPQVMVIACCDSRVDPAIITGAEPGDLFTVRNVANLVPPYERDEAHHGTSAALEFAVTNLGVRHIVVMGHSGCGGIRALVEDDAPAAPGNDFISTWMAIAHSARERASAATADDTVEARAALCEHEALKSSLANLMTFPWIERRVADGALSLHAWHYDISRSAIARYDDEVDRFVPL